jgi:hypothetical protein
MDTFSILSSSVLPRLSTTRKPTTVRGYRYVQRTKRIPKKAKYIHLDQVAKVKTLLQHRCSENCMGKLNSDIILNFRQNYLSKSALEANKWIRNYLELNKVQIRSNTSVRWQLDGIDICKSCWMMATTITPYKLKYCFRETHMTSGTLKVTGKLSSIIVWLGNYFDSVCEKMPSREEFHLPNFIFWNDVLKELNTFLLSEGRRKTTPSYFSKVGRATLHSIFGAFLTIFRSEKNISQRSKPLNIPNKENVIFVLN